MMAAKGWAAKEVLDAYTRARVLCEELGDERELFIVLRGEGQYRMIRGESGIARKPGRALCRPGRRLEGHRRSHRDPSSLLDEQLLHGRVRRSGFPLREGDLALRAGPGSRADLRLFGARSGRLLPRLLCSDPVPRTDIPIGLCELCQEALDLAQQLEHPLTTALAHWAYSFAHILRREPEPARHLGGARDRRLQGVPAAFASFPGDLPARLGARRARRSRRRNRSHARRARSDQRDGRRDGIAVFRRPARRGAGQGGQARRRARGDRPGAFAWRISMAGASSSPRCCA